MKMNSMNVAYIIIFGCFTLYSKAYAACNTCSEMSYAACGNSSSYTLCPDGQNALGEIRHCPENTICTDKQGICLPKDSGEPGCALGDCNVCWGIFACLSDKNYGYCDAKGNIMTVAACEDEQVCSIEYFKSSKAICAKKCDTTPTCSNSEITTIAPTTASYKDSCNEIKTAGYYPVKNDRTCTKYVYCESLNGVMNSVLRTCSSGYFDSVKQICVGKKPSNCN